MKWYVNPDALFSIAPRVVDRNGIIPHSVAEITRRLLVKGIRPKTPGRFFAKDIQCHTSNGNNNAAIYVTDMDGGSSYAWCFVCEDGRGPAKMIEGLLLEI